MVVKYKPAKRVIPRNFSSFIVNLCLFEFLLLVLFLTNINCTVVHVTIDLTVSFMFYVCKIYPSMYY